MSSNSMTEQTAQRIASALERIATALESGVDMFSSAVAYDGAYVARSIVGGIEGIKAENKRARRTTRRAKS